MDELFYTGTERAVYVFGGCDGFRRWAQRQDNPQMSRLFKAIHWIADRTQAELISSGHVWKPLAASKPKLFEIKKGQVRVYCCFCSKGIMMLHWAVKNQQKASKEDLEIAQRRAKEVHENE
jgi:phage-related protein